MALGKFGGYKPGEQAAISDIAATQRRVMGGDSYAATLRGKEFISDGKGGSAMSPSSAGKGGGLAPTSTGQPNTGKQFFATNGAKGGSKQTQNGGPSSTGGNNPLANSPKVKAILATGKDSR